MLPPYGAPFIEREDVKMASRSFTLAHLAKAVGMRFEDVKFYRDRGLLQAPRRKRGRTATLAYHQEHVDRLRFIERALRHGFSVEAIAQLVDLNAMRTCGDVARIATRELEALRRRMGPDDRTVAALEILLAKCPKVGGRDECPILAALEE